MKLKPGELVGGIRPSAMAVDRLPSSEREEVPLKRVCALAGVDPKVARRILREKGKRPGGRWAWSDVKAKKIVELLKKEVTNGAK